MNKIQMYYWLVKPGIVYGNAVAVMAGFFLASSHIGHFDLATFLVAVLGTALVISSACAFNNYIDRGIDSKMTRTKKRTTVSGKVSPRAVIVYATLLGLIGFSLLILYVNWLAAGMAVLAFVAYVLLYSIAKRKTVHGTLIGAISGALPPVIGYTAITSLLDIGALLLFIIMVCWQMPHFYAIAMRRRDEYTAADIPVLPVVRGMYATKIQIIVYIVAFIITNSLLVVYDYVGYVYLTVMTILGALWLIKGVKGFKAESDQIWAKKMFLFSLVVLLVWCLSVSVGGLLP